MAGNGMIMADVESKVKVEELYHALEQSVNAFGQARVDAEARLKQWDSTAKPGFIIGLLQIIGEHNNVGEDIRLLATVVAKNAVGSSWRKTLGSREWARVPTDEKAQVRANVLGLLLSEPSRRVAVQIALLLANVARFDFPTPWTSMLEELVTAASLNSNTNLEGKKRALMALKHVVHALRFKRIVIETSATTKGHVSREELGSLGQQITAERNLLNQRLTSIFPALLLEWQAAWAGAIQNNLDFADIGNRCLQVLRELIMVMPTWEGIENEMRQFMEANVVASREILNVLPGGVEDGVEQPNPLQLAMTKAFERMAQCVLGAMDKNPVEFAPFLTTFLNLYRNAAIDALDARMVQRVRPKRRVVLVKFLTAAFGSVYYSSTWAKEQRQRMAEHADTVGVSAVALAAVEEAAAHIDQLFNDGEVTRHLLKEVISKYVMLTPEELADWQNDPEDYVRSADVEASPDADTPKPCGIKLILAMLERGGTPVASCLFAITVEIQAVPQTPAVVLLREACYRVIGEASDNEGVISQFVFADWYNNELRALLQAPDNQAPDGSPETLARHVLHARAIWLVGVMGNRLPPELWTEALGLVASGLSRSDLVLALSSVASLIAMTAGILEDKETVRALDERVVSIHGLEDAAQEAELRASTAARMAGLTAASGPMLMALFGLLERLSEMECMVRVLQLVSVLVEVLGDQILPHLGIITRSLPQVWSTASKAAMTGREGGAAARLHSALIAVLTHLISRIGGSAVNDAQVATVLWPLLEYATNPAGAETETLLEEAFRLIQAVLSACPTPPSPVMELLPRLLALLAVGKNNRPLLLLLEGYLLMSPPEAMFPYMPQFALAIQRSVETAFNALTLAAAVRKSQPDDVPLGSNEDTTGVRAMQALKDSVPEAMAAASLSIALSQTCPDVALPQLPVALRTMAEVVASEFADGDRMPPALNSLSEGFLEVLGRVVVRDPNALAPLLGRLPPSAQDTFFDRWLSVALIRQLEELFGPPALAAAGRLRRHLAAAAFCNLICTAPPPSLASPGRLVRALRLCHMAQDEEERLQGDKAEIETIIRELQEGPDAVDQILLRRLQLSAADSIRHLNLKTAIQAAVQAASHLVPEAQLMETAAVAGDNVENWLRGSLHPEHAMLAFPA